MGDHADFKRIILCNEEFTRYMVENVNYVVSNLKEFILKKYSLVEDATPD